MIVRRDDADDVARRLTEGGTPAYRIGEIREGEPGVEWE
jgi:phosphoribosylaminoimidazole (AIR) synthetase